MISGLLVQTTGDILCMRLVSAIFFIPVQQKRIAF
jgi:hypothetical protein